MTVVQHGGDSQAALFDAAALHRLVEVRVDRGYRAVGPTLRDHAIALAELGSASDLPRGRGVPEHGIVVSGKPMYLTQGRDSGDLMIKEHEEHIRALARLTWADRNFVGLGCQGLIRQTSK